MPALVFAPPTSLFISDANHEMDVELLVGGSTLVHRLCTKVKITKIKIKVTKHREA